MDVAAIVREWPAAAAGWAVETEARLGRWTRIVRSHLRTDPLPCRPVVAVAAWLAAGCGLVRLLPALPGGWAVPAWCGSGAAIVAWAVCTLVGPRRWGTACLAVAVAALGAAWSAARFDLFAAADLGWQLGDSPTPLAVVGTVVESPRPLPVPLADPRRAAALGPSSEFLVAVERVRDGRRWRPATGQAAVVVDGAPPQITPGMRVRLLGRGLRPAPALNPAEFDFRLRARAQRCLSLVRVRSPREVRVLHSPPWWWPPTTLELIRQRGLTALETHVAPDRRPLAAALLLGRRESLPRAENDDFLVTGTVHILSISGLHVGLLALALFAVMRTASLPRPWALVAVAAVTGGYMLLVQAETPVVRATLLVWLSCLAAAVGRRATAINGLAVAAIVILAFAPTEVFSTGAQLSFLSTAVLVGAAGLLPHRRRPTDPIERLIDRSRPAFVRFGRRMAWHAWTLFAAGLAVWLATAPLVAARFHVVSPVGLVLNVVVSPFVALAMAWGFLCLLLAPCSTWLADWCGTGCDVTLACISQMVSLAADVPAGHAWVAAPPDWWVCGWYLGLAAAVLVLPPPRLARAGTWAALAGVWMAVGLAGHGIGRAAGAGPGELRAVMAALGHGCGIVVRSPLGRCLVYDAGRLGAPAAARRALAAVLWSEGVSRIDTLVISHADADHFNAVPELLVRFAVGELVVTEAFVRSPSAGVVEVLDAAAARGVPVRLVRAGDSFAVDPLCRVRVLHADCDRDAVSDNERSLVLAVEAAGRRMLLTGDLEGPALADFVAADPDSCDVLVAPHHGSRTSLPADIAAATRPALVLVSGVGGAAWSEVAEAYAEAAGGSRVLKTGGEGAIAVSLSARDIRVSRFVGGRWRPVPE